jgi:hypothetical protein
VWPAPITSGGRPLFALQIVQREVSAAYNNRVQVKAPRCDFVLRTEQAQRGKRV